MFSRTSAQKWQIGLSLGLVFILILGTNHLDNKHFESIQQNINSIYQDRLVAKAFLYEISENIHDIEKLDSAGFAAFSFAQTDSLMSAFGSTNLTMSENEEFKRLQRNYDRLKKINPGEKEALNKRTNAMLENLRTLNAIQLKEGRRKHLQAEDLLDRNSFLSYLELGVLFFIALGVQVLIFYKPKES